MSTRLQVLFTAGLVLAVASVAAPQTRSVVPLPSVEKVDPALPKSPSGLSQRSQECFGFAKGRLHRRGHTGRLPARTRIQRRPRESVGSDHREKRRLRIIAGNLALSTLLRYWARLCQCRQALAGRRKQIREVVETYGWRTRPWLEYDETPYVFVDTEPIAFDKLDFLIKGTWRTRSDHIVLEKVINAETRYRMLKAAVALHSNAAERLYERYADEKVAAKEGEEKLEAIETTAGPLLIAHVERSLKLVWLYLEEDVTLYRDAFRGLRDFMRHAFCHNEVVQFEESMSLR